jgi:hypothetical protein
LTTRQVKQVAKLKNDMHMIASFASLAKFVIFANASLAKKVNFSKFGMASYK